MTGKVWVGLSTNPDGRPPRVDVGPPRAPHAPAADEEGRDLPALRGRELWPQRLGEVGAPDLGPGALCGRLPGRAAGFRPGEAAQQHAPHEARRVHCPGGGAPGDVGGRRQAAVALVQLERRSVLVHAALQQDVDASAARGGGEQGPHRPLGRACGGEGFRWRAAAVGVRAVHRVDVHLPAPVRARREREPEQQRRDPHRGGGR